MVMILVLTFMFSVPAFTISTYKNDSEKFSYGLKVVADFFEPPILIYNSPPNSVPTNYPYNLSDILQMSKLPKQQWNVTYQSENMSKVFNQALQSYIDAH